MTASEREREIGERQIDKEESLLFSTDLDPNQPQFLSVFFLSSLNQTRNK